MLKSIALPDALIPRAIGAAVEDDEMCFIRTHSLSVVQRLGNACRNNGFKLPFFPQLLQNPPADHHFLYLARPLVDLCDFCVAHESFHMVFFHKAIAAVNLNRLNRSVHRYFRSKEFRHCTRFGVVGMLVFEPRGFKAK